MTKIIFAILFAIMPTVQAYEFPLVMLKAGGDYSAHNYITENEAECSRIINFNNVALIRTFEKTGVLVDGHINITFKNAEEREKFLKGYQKYITMPKAEPKKWWQF